jgi:hypothetical protein
MVSKSFIAYTCLFGFTTSINALRVTSGRHGSPAPEHEDDVHQVESSRTNPHARNLLGNKILSHLGGIHFETPVYASPFPTQTSSPDVVSYRDLEDLEDRGHHRHHHKRPHSHTSSPSPPLASPTDVVEKRGLEALAENELHSGEESIHEKLYDLIRRLEHVTSEHGVSSGRSDSAPPLPQTGRHNYVGNRGLFDKIDNLNSHAPSFASLPTKVLTSTPTRLSNPIEFYKPKPGKTSRSSERFIDESQNLNRRLKVTSTSGQSFPRPVETETDEPQVAQYRDLEGLMDRTLTERSIVKFITDHINRKKVSGTSTSAVLPAQSGLPNRRRANSERTCKFFWLALM